MTLAFLACILSGFILSIPIIRTLRGIRTPAAVRIPQRRNIRR